MLVASSRLLWLQKTKERMTPRIWPVAPKSYKMRVWWRLPMHWAMTKRQRRPSTTMEVYHSPSIQTKKAWLNMTTQMVQSSPTTQVVRSSLTTTQMGHTSPNWAQRSRCRVKIPSSPRLAQSWEAIFGTWVSICTRCSAGKIKSSALHSLINRSAWTTRSSRNM